MTLLQTWLLCITGAVGLVAAIIGIYRSSLQNKVFAETPWLLWLGIFVWGDAIIIGGFWFLVAVITGWLQDWLLFLLCVSIFWLVRSFGETIYWLLEQFSSLTRNPPKNLWGYQWIKSEALWFLYQVFWQCVTVATSISSLYLAFLWLRSRF